MEILETVCCDYIATKEHTSPFPLLARHRENKPLESIYGDIYKPVSPVTPRGSKYFLLYVHDFSRLVWVYMIKDKEKPHQAFVKLKNLAEAKKIGCLRTDVGEEFSSLDF